MTLNSRNKIFITALILCTMTLLAYTLGALYLFIEYPDYTTMDKLLTSPETSPINAIAPLFVINLFILIAGIILLRSFRKTTSAEIFFYFLFLMSFGAEGLRMVLIYINVLDLPFQMGMTISRAIFFFRFFGSLCLFSTGLYSCGIPYQRLELMLGSITLAALALSTSIPLETGVKGADLIYNNGSASEFAIGFIIIEALTVFSFIYAVQHHNNQSYFFLAMAMAMVVTGRSLMFYANNILFMGVGFVLIISGTILFGTRTHKVYLWF